MEAAWDSDVASLGSASPQTEEKTEARAGREIFSAPKTFTYLEDEDESSSEDDEAEVEEDEDEVEEEDEDSEIIEYSRGVSRRSARKETESFLPAADAGELPESFLLKYRFRGKTISALWAEADKMVMTNQDKDDLYEFIRNARDLRSLQVRLFAMIKANKEEE